MGLRLPALTGRRDDIRPPARDFLPAGPRAFAAGRRTSPAASPLAGKRALTACCSAALGIDVGRRRHRRRCVRPARRCECSASERVADVTHAEPARARTTDALERVRRRSSAGGARAGAVAARPLPALGEARRGARWMQPDSVSLGLRLTGLMAAFAVTTALLASGLTR